MFFSYFFFQKEINCDIMTTEAEILCIDASSREVFPENLKDFSVDYCLSGDDVAWSREDNEP